MGLGSSCVMLLLACGGRVDPGSKGSGENTPTKLAPATSSSSSASNTGIDNPNADTDLGPCTLGPMEFAEPDQPCAWVVDNRCYQTHEMACNCACPRTRNSQCVSGFDDGPDGHVWVACN